MTTEKYQGTSRAALVPEIVLRAESQPAGIIRIPLRRR